MVDVFTTGTVSKMISVSARTVALWIDNKLLKGYTVPGSKDRRVSRAALVDFMMANDVPIRLLTAYEAGERRAKCFIGARKRNVRTQSSSKF